jgi:hypothetical protein
MGLSVSLVIPSYQQAAYLEATLQSALAQGVALEIVVQDGGSSDGSVAIIERYADRLAGWSSGRDRGQADAINRGFRQTHGEVVGWLNSDDLLLPGAVPAAVAQLEAHPELGLVYGDALTIDPAGRPLNFLRFPDWGLEDLAAFRVICQPAVWLRRAALEEAGLLDESYHFMLDHQLWLRLAAVAPLAHVPALWAAARAHPAAKNVAQAARFAAEIDRVAAWLEHEPRFAPPSAAAARRRAGGAARLAARYLLDGGQPAAALRRYGRALRLDPAYALAHRARILYALLALVGLGGAVRSLYARQHARPNLQPWPELAAWPGLNLTPEAPHA